MGEEMTRREGRGKGSAFFEFTGGFWWGVVH
jgi:hypothetical protein